MKPFFFVRKYKFLLIVSFLIATFLPFGLKAFSNHFSFLKPPKVSAGYQSPQIYIYGGDSGYSSAGLITLASTDKPEVQIGGYNISGPAEITMYKADIPAVLNYLTHNKDDKQTKGSPDVNSFQFVATTQHDINTSSYAGSAVNLPFTDTGVWYLKIKVGSVSSDAFVLRSNTGVLAKQGNNEFILWGQDFKTKKSVTGGSVQIYNLRDGQNVIQTTDFDSTGIAHAGLSTDADLALAHFGDDVAIVPLNLKYLNTGNSWDPFAPPAKQTKYFTFTDRPLYKPGDTVYFKSVLRDDDDARYSIPTGLAKVKVSSDYSGQDALLDTNVPISGDGTIAGEYKIPSDSKVGYYYLSVIAGNGTYGDSTSFDVEYYKKPEFFINVTTSKSELVAENPSTFKVTGTYFSGQPLSAQKIKYRITSSDFYEYEYLNDAQSLSQSLSGDYKYSYWNGSHTVLERTAVLDDKGEANIDFSTKMDFNSGKSQVFSIEATIDDGSQSPSFSRKNVLVYAGLYGIYRSDNSYGGKVNTKINLPVTIVQNLVTANLSGVDLTAKVHRENWVAYQDPTQKYPVYKKEEEDLPDLSGKTDSKGNATISFTPSKVGFYKLTVQGKDTRGNTIAKIFYEYITDTDQPAYTPQADNQLTIATDKLKYNSSDIARISVYSAIPDRDVFLSLERGRMDRFKIIHLSGKNGSVDIPLISSDIPNMFAKISSFSDGGIDSNVIDLPVSSNSKRVLVSLTPNSKKYGPGDNVNLEVSTKDGNGNPVSADVAVWAVDKAIFELSDSTLGNIFDTFWQERYDNTQEAHSLEGILVYSSERGGCFVQGTKVLMGSGKTKNIEDIKPGDLVLTRESIGSSKTVEAKVVSTQKAVDNGYMIINNSLRITPDHIMWINGAWSTAGSIQNGDKLIDQDGKSVLVYSTEWQSGKTSVYNLDVEKYHTFFANGIFVHNQKGDSRSTFKDTAYWNPSIHTDSSGKGQVSFKLPDNLTTWTIAAVANTTNTQVGQTTAEVTVSKDIVIRPILPNILRIGDVIELSALAQNFTETDHNFDAKLTFDSGSATSPDYSKLAIRANSMERLYWQVKPEMESDTSKLTFSVSATDDNKLTDTVIQEIPTKPFEFEEKSGESGSGNKTYNISLPPNLNKDKTNITLSLSPTLLGTLPSAMRYLINYPYGCAEQLTSSLASALIAKSNTTLFSDAVKDKNLDDIINKGISKIQNSMQPGGGWTWWFSGESNPFLTAYVVDNLVAARNLGYKVDENVLSATKNYLEQSGYYNYKTSSQSEYGPEEWAAKDYGLMVLGGSDKFRKIDNLTGLSPDLLSMYVIANFQHGDKNPNTNGLNNLMSLVNKQGDASFWNPGAKFNFGSKDASTAMAVRAIILAGGDVNTAGQGVLYLVRNRQYDYWSNTFATSQVIRAILSYSKVENDLNPNFNYTVSLDGGSIANGQVVKSGQLIKDLIIPASKIKETGSVVSVKLDGQGQLYSTVLKDEFNTDKNAESKSNGVSIKREYVNEKGEQYSISTGDSVTVKLTVSGLQTDTNYAVITDELPSGMVPVNPNFNNEQFGTDTSALRNSYFGSGYVSGMDVTQNGAVLSLANLTTGEHTFTYRARVVAAGDFFVPPATVSLMYAPEINGRSAAQKISIDKVSKIIPTVAVRNALFNLKPVQILIAVGLVVILGASVFLWKKGMFAKIFKKKNSIPPIDTPPDPPPPPPVTIQ